MRTGRTVALVLATMLVAGGCGSRRSYGELLAGEAASGGAVQQAATAQQPVANGANAAGAPTAAQEPSAPAAAAAPDQPGAAATAAAPADGSTSPAGAPAGSCTGPKAPIVLGSVGTQSGVIGSAIGPAALAVQAWAAYVNAKGGIHCHPVKYLIADDGGDPSRHQALVRQMVEQNGVVAFLQMSAPLTGHATVAYLASKGIPVIGNEGASPWFNENPTYFTATGTGDTLVEAIFVAGAEAARESGKTRLGLVSCIEAQLCSRAGGLFADYARKYGGQLVYRSQASLVQPDYTANCRAAKDAGAEVQFVFLDGNSVQRFARSCKSVSYDPIYVVQALSMTPQLPADPNLQGLRGAVLTAPWTLTDVPAVAEHRQVIARYAPGLTPGAATMQGWVAAKLFEAATADVADPTTSQSILQAMWTVKGNDLGGLTYPITFTQGQRAERTYCVWTVAVNDGKYTSPGLDSRRCANV